MSANHTNRLELITTNAPKSCDWVADPDRAGRAQLAGWPKPSIKMRTLVHDVETRILVLYTKQFIAHNVKAKQKLCSRRACRPRGFLYGTRAINMLVFHAVALKSVRRDLDEHVWAIGFKLVAGFDGLASIQLDFRSESSPMLLIFLIRLAMRSPPNSSVCIVLVNYFHKTNQTNVFRAANRKFLVQVRWSR